MYCKQCGSQIDDNSQFCSTCGYNLTESTQITPNGVHTGTVFSKKKDKLTGLSLVLSAISTLFPLGIILNAPLWVILGFLVLIPAFMISELQKAFIMGFLIYLPFIVMDMVVSSTLMSMGMMMLPPTVISLPFKLLLFVLADGWNLIIGELVKTFY